MASKQVKMVARSGGKLKKVRNAISLSTKLEITKRIDGGQ
jgi:hypothetical protein